MMIHCVFSLLYSLYITKMSCNYFVITFCIRHFLLLPSYKYYLLGVGLSVLYWMYDNQLYISLYSAVHSSEEAILYIYVDLS